MASRPVITVPRSVEGLARIWREIPFQLVLAWAAAGAYPSLSEQLAALEAERAGEP